MLYRNLLTHLNSPPLAGLSAADCRPALTARCHGLPNHRTPGGWLSGGNRGRSSPNEIKVGMATTRDQSLHNNPERDSSQAPGSLSGPSKSNGGRRGRPSGNPNGQNGACTAVQDIHADLGRVTTRSIADVPHFLGFFTFLVSPSGLPDSHFGEPPALGAPIALLGKVSLLDLRIESTQFLTTSLACQTSAFFHCTVQLVWACEGEAVMVI